MHRCTMPMHIVHCLNGRALWVPVGERAVSMAGAPQLLLQWQKRQNVVFSWFKIGDKKFNSMLTFHYFNFTWVIFFHTILAFMLCTPLTFTLVPEEDAYSKNTIPHWELCHHFDLSGWTGNQLWIRLALCWPFGELHVPTTGVEASRHLMDSGFQY